MMLNDNYTTSFKFGLGVKPDDDDDELSDEDGGAQAYDDDELLRIDDDYFKGALASSFSLGCQ